MIRKEYLEKRKIYDKKYRMSEKGKKYMREYMVRYYATKKGGEKLRLLNKKYRMNNKDKLKERFKKYKTTINHVLRVQRSNRRKTAELINKIDLCVYNRITKECAVCRFSEVVDLHHIDGNHKNNSLDNLVGLCPNHHFMIHRKKYSLEKLLSLGGNETVK